MKTKLNQKRTLTGFILLITMLIGNPALSQNVDLTEFKNGMLSAHNTLRDLHQDTSPLALDDALSSQAQSWAEHLLSIGRLEHDSDMQGAGANLYYTFRSNKPRPPQEFLDSLKQYGYSEEQINQTYPPALTGAGLAATATLNWYSESDNYSYSTHQSANGKVIGHFTQLVWKDTTKIGCGVAIGPENAEGYIKVYVVCRYSPGGNVPGEYSANVMPRKSGAVTPTEEELSQ